MDVGERRARTLARWAIVLAVVFWLHQRLMAKGGLYRNSLDTAFSDPVTGTKVLMMASAAIIALALPLALADWRAERRYKRAVEQMRARRWLSSHEPYAGPEGTGALFAGPEGRVLVLRALGGLGAPRIVELPPEAAPLPLSGTPAPRPDEQASTGAQA